MLGSTGSIGVQTLDVIARHPDRLQVVGLAAGRNADQLKQQASALGVRRVALFKSVDPDIPSGLEAITELATADDVDLVVVSVAGVIGLQPTVAAIAAHKDIALASKEVLVAAGEVVMPLIAKHGVKLTPIDSEHSAIFQCLQGYRSDQIAELILTASGGPFRGWSKDQLRSVSVGQALNHPTWRMGGKITVDSATLMNKALETIEARWLFDVPMDRIRAVVHPESIVHSMVRFRDGSVLGQMGWPDMRLPIEYALLHPERVASGTKPWNPVETPSLTFEPINHEVFPALGLAKEAAACGGTMPCAFNAANEEAANAFLRGEIPFLGIVQTVQEVMSQHRTQGADLASIAASDLTSREIARKVMKALPQ